MLLNEFQRLKMVISIEEMPEEFIRVLQESYDDVEQAALDYLMEEQVTPSAPHP